MDNRFQQFGIIVAFPLISATFFVIIGLSCECKNLNGCHHCMMCGILALGNSGEAGDERALSMDRVSLPPSFSPAGKSNPAPLVRT